MATYAAITICKFSLPARDQCQLGKGGCAVFISNELKTTSNEVKHSRVVQKSYDCYTGLAGQNRSKTSGLNLVVCRRSTVEPSTDFNLLGGTWLNGSKMELPMLSEIIRRWVPQPRYEHPTNRILNQGKRFSSMTHNHCKSHEKALNWCALQTQQLLKGF
jgi:hypothetical protein